MLHQINIMPIYLKYINWTSQKTQIFLVTKIEYIHIFIPTYTYLYLYLYPLIPTACFCILLRALFLHERAFGKQVTSIIAHKIFIYWLISKRNFFSYSINVGKRSEKCYVEHLIQTEVENRKEKIRFNGISYGQYFLGLLKE